MCQDFFRRHEYKTYKMTFESKLLLSSPEAQRMWTDQTKYKLRE